VHGGLERRVIEPLTVLTLADVVRQLADEVHGGRATAAISLPLSHSRHVKRMSTP